MSSHKTTRPRSARTPAGAVFDGYEIHMGRTSSVGLKPFAIVEDGSEDGVRHGRVLGTYLHGALESPAVFREIFGVEPSAQETREQAFDSMAVWLESNASVKVLDQLIG